MQEDDEEEPTLFLKKQRATRKDATARDATARDFRLVGKLICLDSQLLEPPTQTRERWLTNTEELVGRGDDCSIVIYSPELSRRHARFSAYSNQWIVEDCNSRNGVWLNNERIAARKTVSNGDTLRFGRIPFRFEVLLLTGEEATTKAAANPKNIADGGARALQETVLDVSNTNVPLAPQSTETRHKAIIANAKAFSTAAERETGLDASLRSLQDALPDIIDTLVHKARGGDVEAAKACIDVLRWQDQRSSVDISRDPT